MHAKFQISKKCLNKIGVTGMLQAIGQQLKKINSKISFIGYFIFYKDFTTKILCF